MTKTITGSILIPEQFTDEHARQFPDSYRAPNAQLVFAIRALAQRVHERNSEWLAPLGLTAAKFQYLSLIHATGEAGVTLHEIAMLQHSSNASVTLMIRGLEQDGLVTRKSNPLDGRSTLVRLRAKGVRLAEEAIVKHHERLESVLSDIAPSERDRVLHLLVRLGKAFEPPAEGDVAELRPAYVASRRIALANRKASA